MCTSDRSLERNLWSKAVTYRCVPLALKVVHRDRQNSKLVLQNLRGEELERFDKSDLHIAKANASAIQVDGRELGHTF